MFNIFELSGLFGFEGGLQLSILVPRGVWGGWGWGVGGISTHAETMRSSSSKNLYKSLVTNELTLPPRAFHRKLY